MLRAAPVGLRLKAALPVAAALSSHGNLSPRHVTAYWQRPTSCGVPAVTAPLVQHAGASPTAHNRIPET